MSAYGGPQTADVERDEAAWSSKDHAEDRPRHLRIAPPPNLPGPGSCRHRYWVDRVIHAATDREQRVTGWAYCGVTLWWGSCPHHGEPS